MGPIKNILSLVQIMAWRQPCDKPLSEAMMAYVTDTYASLGLNELTALYTKYKWKYSSEPDELLPGFPFTNMV